MLRLRKTLAVLGASLAMAAGASIAASPLAGAREDGREREPKLGQTVSLSTADSGPGGSAYYAGGLDTGEYLTVQDVRRDGYAARATLYAWSNEKDKYVKVKTLRAAGFGNQKKDYVNVREGRSYRLKVCLERDSEVKFCNDTYASA
jgi:hypothetical protein